MGQRAARPRSRAKAGAFYAAPACGSMIRCTGSTGRSMPAMFQQRPAARARKHDGECAVVQSRWMGTERRVWQVEHGRASRAPRRCRAGAVGDEEWARPREACTERSERAFCPVSMRTAPPSQRLDSISLRAKVERLRASWAGRRVCGGRTVLGSLSFARRDTARSYSEPRCASSHGQQRS